MSDPQLLKSVLEFGSFGLIVFIVVYTIRWGLPSVLESFRLHLHDQSDEFLTAVINTRTDFKESLTMQRQDFMKALADQRADTSRQLEDLKASIEKLASAVDRETEARMTGRSL